MLKAGEDFIVIITIDEHVSPKRPPFSMFTIVHQHIKNYSNSIAYDLDEDGREEFVTSSGNTMYVLKSDGDSEEDILLYSFNRLQHGKNPGSDYGPKNKIFYTHMKYRILSNDLSRVIKEVSIAEEWDTWRGFKIIDIDRPEMEQYPFIALSDKITIFNF
jgi:hypothetical protein